MARALAPLAEARQPRWVLRQPRRLDACARLAMRGLPSVLVVKVGRDVSREMAVLDRVRAASPEVPIVVVAAAASPALTGLAWHLGAAYVFTTEPPAETLAAVVERLLQRTSETFGARAQHAPADEHGSGAAESDADDE